MFNIKVGTAITLATSDGSKAEGELADVTYNDVWEHELFPREAKLQWLEQGAENGTQPGAIQINRGSLDDFRPVPFSTQGWPSLAQAFSYKKSGAKTGADGIFVAIDRRDLPTKVAPKLEGRADPAYNSALETNIVYRPLDQRWLYNDLRLLNRPGPEMQKAWGASNIALYAMPLGTGEGPATWCHALLPDYHAFSGRGGYAFPLHDRRGGHGQINLNPKLLEGLVIAYASKVNEQAVFDAMLALLSAASYTLRFAEDLEDTFPHVPFPADKALFDRAAEIGEQIRDVETFARPPDAQFLTPNIARIETAPHGPMADIGPESWSEGDLILCANGSGKVSGIPRNVWEFAVSGYPVLPRWLGARKGIEVTHDILSEFRDITGRIHELIYRFDEADLVLQEALNHSLTRDQLGL